MTDISMDISGKIDDPIIVELITQLDLISRNQSIPFFVVGATARDMVLWHGFGIRPGRATRDVDVGVNVSSWEQYDDLKAALQASGLFKAEGDKQRMSFQEQMKIDILPFGEIVDSEFKVAWRPDGDTELNLLGFEEAYNNAISVRISSNPIVDVKIASAVGLVLLKIFAWEDRKPINKDAIDLGILIRSYMQIGNEARLFSEHEDLLESDGFDFDIAGAHILGRDLAEICGEETGKRLLKILNRELDSEGDLPLVVQSAGSSPEIDKTLEFWEAIKQELVERESLETQYQDDTGPILSPKELYGLKYR